MKKDLKNLKYFKAMILAVFVLFPIGVFAAPTFNLECPSTVKKGATVECNLRVTAMGANETLTGVVGTYTADNKFSTSTSGNIDESSLNITSTGRVYTIQTVAGSSAGNGTISVSITAATGTRPGADVCSNEAYSTQEECEAEGGTWGPSTVTGSLIADTISLSKTVNILDNDTTITSIRIDSIANSSCKLNENNCAITNLNKSSVRIDVAAVSGATVTGNQVVNLSCGSNSHKVVVTAADGTTRDYNFSLTRVCDSNTTLRGITLSTGTLNPTFSATNKEYKVEVTSDIDKITISGTKAVESQTITGNVTNRALQYGDNKFTLTVTSEEGATGTYTITVTRKDDRSDNNLLQSITLNSGNLNPAFNKDVDEYRVRVLYEVEKIEVEAQAENEKATVTYEGLNNNLVVGENRILIKVRSENQQEKVYTLIVERLEEGEALGNNPNLTNITVADYELGFNYNQYAYTLEIENEDRLDITVALEEATSTFEIKGNENLKNGSVITITVTSLDGTTKDYTITIEKSNTMLFIIIAGVVLLVAIALVVYLLIKNKKDKDSLTTKKIKKQLKRDDEILAKVQSQLNEIEPVVESPVITPTTPVTINPEATRPQPVVTESPVVDREPIPTEVTKTPVVPTSTNDEEVEEPRTEATRVCSICGHRVSVTLKTCPYCKRSF